MQLRFVIALVVSGAPLAVAADQGVEFNRDIRPILSDKCYTCHGPDAANRKTKLRFDVESGAKIELAKGRLAIVPGDPLKSEKKPLFDNDRLAAAISRILLSSGIWPISRR